MATSKKGSTGKKSVDAKKAPQKKAVTKKAAAKKAVTKKAAIKKTAAKKSVLKKTGVREAPLKKAAKLPAENLAQVPDSVVIKDGKLIRTREERRRQLLALIFSFFMVFLALVFINRHEGLDKVKKLRSGAFVAEKAKQYHKAIDKLSAALTVLGRIQGRVDLDQKKSHRLLNKRRKRIQEDLKRNLLKEARRLQALAKQLEGDGKDDQAVDALKKMRSILERLSKVPWDKDARLQKDLLRRLDAIGNRIKSIQLKDEEVDRLLKRARQDEEDGLYRDAKRMLGLVLDRLDMLEKELRDKDPEERDAWRSRLRGLRRQVRRARQRLERKILEQERKNTHRSADKDDAAARRLREQNRLLRERNRRLQDARRKKARQSGTSGKSGSGTTGATGIQPKDIKDRIKDVKVKGKDKVDYDKSAGIEKD